MLKIVLFFIFTNLIQIEEKTCVPVTVSFPNYAFNENRHNKYCFHKWDVFLIHLFMTNTKDKEHISFESWEKNKLLLVQFSVKIVMLPAWSIMLVNWFACMPVCTSVIVWVSLTILHLKETQTISIYWFYLLHSHADISAKSK